MISRPGMIWSVSILIRMSGAAMPVILTSCSIGRPSSVRELTGVGDVPGERRRGDRRRARQMGPGPWPLPALEIAVCRADDALILQPVVAHVAAERATGFMPFETGLLEDRVEPFRLRRRLDLGRAGNAEAGHTGRDLVSL